MVVGVTSGGKRNRNRQPDESSGRSERRGYSLTALPAEGYEGEAPAFPLPEPTAREIELWEWAWATPQACAWSMPSESWRVRTVALWVRLSVKCEDPEVGAAHLAQLHRFSDQIGMTTAGLAEMGWKIAVDELAEREARQPRDEAAEAPAVPPRRMRAVGGGA